MNMVDNEKCLAYCIVRVIWQGQWQAFQLGVQHNSLFSDLVAGAFLSVSSWPNNELVCLRKLTFQEFNRISL